MREEYLPWIPASFCGVLSLITLTANIAVEFLTGSSNGGLIVFLCFMPICFLQVGQLLRKLQRENLDLQKKLNDLSKLQESVH